MWLPDNSTTAFIHVRLNNTGAHPALAYWWTNYAHPSSNRTRVLFPGTRAIIHRYEVCAAWAYGRVGVVGGCGWVWVLYGCMGALVLWVGVDVVNVVWVYGRIDVVRVYRCFGCLGV